MNQTEIFTELKTAVQEFDSERARELAKESLASGIDPIDTLDILTGAIREIGSLFEGGELFLPELIAASEAMTAATEPLEEEIQRLKKEKKQVGTVVIGTVFGDIHDIGKNMVATLFKASGFQVVDCGANVQPSVFIDAVTEHKADILAMSALLTTTAAEQRKIINTLNETGLKERVNVMVGGGGITKRFADEIGADGYSATASGAVALGRKLLGLAEGA